MFHVRVSGLGFRVSGTRLGVPGAEVVVLARPHQQPSCISGCRFNISGFVFLFRLPCFVSRISGALLRFGLQISCFVFQVPGFVFQVSCLGFQVLFFEFWEPSCVSGSGFRVWGLGSGV
jgi:hypothetical protein